MSAHTMLAGFLMPGVHGPLRSVTNREAMDGQLSMVFPLNVGYEKLFARTVQLVETQARSHRLGNADVQACLRSVSCCQIHIPTGLPQQRRLNAARIKPTRLSSKCIHLPGCLPRRIARPGDILRLRSMARVRLQTTIFDF